MSIFNYIQQPKTNVLKFSKLEYSISLKTFISDIIDINWKVHEQKTKQSTPNKQFPGKGI